jgi:hypothetical protein
VQVSNSNGCSASDSVNVAFDFCLSAEELANESFSLYPNPSNGKFTIDGHWNKARCRIFSLIGTSVYDAVLALGKNEIEIHAAGIYLVQIEHNGIISSRKISVASGSSIH